MKPAIAVTALLIAAAACSTPDELDEEAQGDLPAEARGTVTVRLYFPDPDDRLAGEERRLRAAAETPAQRLEALAELWLDGPRDERLVRPLPEVEEIRLGLSPSGRLYVDLVPDDESLMPQLGSTEEQSALYSLVNTFALNVAAVRDVVLLWDGVQPQTLAGHLDTGVPLTPRDDLIANGTRSE